MATSRILSSSVRIIGAYSHVTSGVKAPRPISAMMTLRYRHDAINLRSPLMPQAWIRQQMKRSSTQAPIDIEDRPRLMDLRQGEKVSIFSKAEFESRLRKLRAHMETEGIGAVVLTSMHNINYYSGYLYVAMGRQYGLVITPTSSTVISNGVDGGQPWRRSLGADDNITYTDWQQDNFFYAISHHLSGVVGSIGLELDHVSVDNMRKFEGALPNNKMVDISKPAMRLRMVKSPEEIALIREGARIADIGGAAVLEALHEGVPEYEVALASTKVMVREVAKTYPQAESVDTWTWFMTGINTDGGHNHLTSRRLQKGDIMSLNCFPMIQGYYSAMERTLFFDHVSDAHLRIWEINHAVHERGVELLKPGACCGDIARELNKIYVKHGLLKYRTMGYGHSFGVFSQYFGREPDLELREDIDTVLEPGMVVSMEPMLVIPEGQPGAGGYRDCDAIVVNENGAENLAKFPRGPKHNVIKVW